MPVRLIGVPGFEGLKIPVVLRTCLFFICTALAPEKKNRFFFLFVRGDL
jgi:hypothetical protein